MDAINKAYANRIKYKTTTGIIPNIAVTDHIIFAFLAAKAFVSRKVRICGMWVERLADEWIAASSPMFATKWPGFHKFSRGPFFTTFFTDSLQVDELAIFVSTI